MRGIIERRLLVNYRVDIDVLRGLLPAPFEPRTIGGFGVAGICLIRLGRIRPASLPSPWGLRSENAAHRIAVVLPDGSNGVFIPRRDTDSRVNSMMGARVFPGVHHHAVFDSFEFADRVAVSLVGDDSRTRVTVSGNEAERLPPDTVFSDLETASSFFQQGSMGYSTTEVPGVFDVIELRTQNWNVVPVSVEHHRSTYFEDRSLFPEGSVALDHALVMRNADHEWRAHDRFVWQSPGLDRKAS